MEPQMNTAAVETRRQTDRNDKSRLSDPFYSESNQRYLDRVIADIESGRAVLKPHDLVEP